MTMAGGLMPPEAGGCVGCGFGLSVPPVVVSWLRELPACNTTASLGSTSGGLVTMLPRNFSDPVDVTTSCPPAETTMAVAVGDTPTATAVEIVTVWPPAIVTESPLPGMPDGLQVDGEPQSPLATEV